ncbi:hypothetical protein H8E77_43760 [bacterium]|nr:hypothetical protein [bacterium]
MNTRNNSHIIPIMILTISILFIVGCAARVIDNSKLQYIAPEFNEDSLAKEGLSLLPIVAGAGQEGLRRPLGDKLNKHLSGELPEGKFLGNLETMDLINNAELTEDYSKLIDDYNRSAILNKSTLHKIGEAIGVRYLLYVKLLEQVRTQGLTVGTLTGDLVKTTGKRVNLFGQVWDCTLGDVVWEGTGEVSVESDEMTYVEQTIDELVDMASRSFLKNLPGVQIQKPK